MSDSLAGNWKNYCREQGIWFLESLSQASKGGTKTFKNSKLARHPSLYVIPFLTRYIDSVGKTPNIYHS